MLVQIPDAGRITCRSQSRTRPGVLDPFRIWRCSCGLGEHGRDAPLRWSEGDSMSVFAVPPRGSFAESIWRLVLPRGAVLVAIWGMNQTLHLPGWLAYLLVTGDAALLLLQIARYHGAAEAHIRDTGAMAASWAGYLICLLALLASATLWWDMILIAHRPPAEERYDEKMRRAREALYLLTLGPDGRTVIFEGEITFGLKARLAQTLAQAPDVREIRLSSPGGHVYEARGAAQVIAEAGLATRAVGECSSACTLLFMAGVRRDLSAGARLGFHGYGLGEAVHLPWYDILGAQDKDRAYFIAQGMRPEFAARIFDMPPDRMWYPDPADLRAAGVLRP
ncbi:hypothetical protein MHM88_06520 [Epibacterium sp. MM17-32]|uniref:COG3904 family protein n=1 Tax=Epibacterium sp. MM17-32 TaxID=2917734 RepID=UPI001EF5AA29|nr:hypothetical protein [Epibacterium sp. MM17-32]